MGDLIDPTLAGWNFAERERELFASAKNIPTWRLANQARRFLAAVVHELSHARSAPLVKLVDDLDAGSGRELAVLDLGAVTVRATGSIIVLIGCGCEREAMGQGRTLVEAVIRARQACDDASGDTARKLLKGQRPGSLNALLGADRLIAALVRWIAGSRRTRGPGCSRRSRCRSPSSASRTRSP